MQSSSATSKFSLLFSNVFAFLDRNLVIWLIEEGCVIHSNGLEWPLRVVYSNSLKWPRRSLRLTIWRSLRNFALMMYYQKRVPFISYNTLWWGLLPISQNSKLTSEVTEVIYLEVAEELCIYDWLGLLMISQNRKSTLMQFIFSNYIKF